MKELLERIGPAKALCILYNTTAPSRIGWLQYDPAELTEDTAKEILAHSTNIDWLAGRPIKSDFNPENPDFSGFDRVYGLGTAETLLELAEIGRDLSSLHERFVKASKIDTENLCKEHEARAGESPYSDVNGTAVITLTWDAKTIARIREAMANA